MSVKAIFINAVIFCGILFSSASAQIKWVNADDAFAPLPKGFHVFKTTDSLHGKPFIAYYAIADLHEKKLEFTTDTSHKRRLTPQQFFERNQHPLLVVNTTFFSYETNSSINAVIMDGKLVAFNSHSLAGKGKDTLTYRHPFTGALGISKKRKADIAWLYTDSTKKYALASQYPIAATRDSFAAFQPQKSSFSKWKMKTAVGGGPVLLQNGEIKISNNEELKFGGKAINDKHPRTLIGYTADDKLIVMVVQGRFPGLAEGATITEEAELMQQLGCVEAINLDGGGSSCMLINGKPTITVSDKPGQRAVPAVFLIKARK